MPIRDGLYKVSFQTQLGTGNGVVVLDGGKMRGGDSIMHYSGTYSQDGDKFSAKVVTGRHSNTPGMCSVFGMDHVNISVQGTAQGDSAQLRGTAAEAPGVTFQASLGRLGD
jgi:hypothetical protein